MSHIMILLSTPVKEDEKIRHCVVESQGHRVENTPRRKAGVSIVASKTSLSRSLRLSGLWRRHRVLESSCPRVIKSQRERFLPLSFNNLFPFLFFLLTSFSWILLLFSFCLGPCAVSLLASSSNYAKLCITF